MIDIGTNSTRLLVADVGDPGIAEVERISTVTRLGRGVDHSGALSTEAIEEKVSLSDRFGLWLGFHPCDQDQYLDMISGYCAAHGVKVAPDRLRA